VWWSFELLFGLGFVLKRNSRATSAGGIDAGVIIGSFEHLEDFLQ